MSVIYLMLPFALLLGLGFTVAFVWMTAHGQYDDLETPAYRLLLNDEPVDGPARKGRDA
ncbi:MAG: cbb3-type cytochrome oxidase assembly protein CcoS [Oligoflexia bacterium]|nr:cbb3-type cytochrome oxidase assembly protein CcoS [Oligoflexia bacterium]